MFELIGFIFMLCIVGMATIGSAGMALYMFSLNNRTVTGELVYMIIIFGIGIISLVQLFSISPIKVLINN